MPGSAGMLMGLCYNFLDFAVGASRPLGHTQSSPAFEIPKIEQEYENLTDDPRLVRFSGPFVPQLGQDIYRQNPLAFCRRLNLCFFFSSSPNVADPPWTSMSK
ncbi:hypothetical protein FOXG_17881 [Fusarium oxysporum f. sp. lycopersici 4287]|uniref:Uncharacterized protein n=2 Tax=Fusarium oxysporum TaxID=5507 RepID=A0A0J9WG47_FUSO4|nr:hypothetical protein FOXG_17881 [Fusarium oxysporum f. sp. lycopersici 4287]EXK48012.1 hypothetical protein FOMG_01162 [Fusarium oxysporum f. sp. melonis 26406]KNA94401.1 hypothetical protein FOXG_17881 [Fusarium oxysporum f. sp. lycopersici 4287]